MTDKNEPKSDENAPATDRKEQPRSKRVEVNGWVVLDKPVGITSTHAVSRLKRIYNGKKAGHAGTLDPLASGILPIAFGEATKNRAFRAGRREGGTGSRCSGAPRPTPTMPTARSSRAPICARPATPSRRCCRASSARSSSGRPPFSAIKIAGERAYDLARNGEIVDLAPRTVDDPRSRDRRHGGTARRSSRRACGKGTYVRAIARDLGRELGCHGHVHRASPHARRPLPRDGCRAAGGAGRS